MSLNCPKSATDLLNSYKSKPQPKGEKLSFHGVGEKDVYNITAPFKFDGVECLVGRVESPHADWSTDWSDCKVMFFVPYEDGWTPLGDTPMLHLEDPFICFINNELVLGGVQVFPATVEGRRVYKYRTVFYRGTHLHNLEKFTAGPDGMKDIRLIQLQNGQIGVFTRPQDKLAGNLGKIGYTVINSLDELTPNNIQKARVLEDLFLPTEWGGANELFMLDNSKIGVLGHIAHQTTDGAKHYYGMTFSFDSNSFDYSEMSLVATRDNFPEGKAKYPVLQNIIFSGGLKREKDGMATFYAGLSDAEAGRMDLLDPFI